MAVCSNGLRPKVRFASRAEAKESLRRNKVADMHPYRCPVCRYFHVGHYPSDPKVREFFRLQHRRAS